MIITDISKLSLKELMEGELEKFKYFIEKTKTGYTG
jgi:hypothetical protein